VLEAVESEAEPEPSEGFQKIKATKAKKTKRKPPKVLGEIIESYGQAPEQYPDADW
jgi:hypothetical protein